MSNKRLLTLLSSISIILVLGVLSVLVACAEPAPEPLPPVKIGILRGFTGPAATEGPHFVEGIKYVLDEVDWQVAGRRIIILEEDEGDTPDFAVAHARKLVEEDKVDVIMGPLFSHSTLAVSAYLKPRGVPHLPFSSAFEPSDHQFYTHGTAQGNASPAGYYAYDELGARTAAIIAPDFVLGYALTDGFKDAFVGDRGGTVVYEALIKWGTVDMAPYLTAMGEPDVIAIFVTPPTTAIFVRQYHEYGLTMPVIWLIADVVSGERLQALGDEAVGMYGQYPWVVSIDTPFNKAFVKGFVDKHGHEPEGHVVHGFWNTIAYLEALKMTGGDTDGEKITQALLEMEPIETPSGPLSFNADRVSTSPTIYVLEIVKEDDKLYLEVVKTYTNVKARY